MKEGAQTDGTYVLRGSEDISTDSPSNFKSGSELES